MPNHIHQHSPIPHPQQELPTPPQQILFWISRPHPPRHLAHTASPLPPYRERLLPPSSKRHLLHHRRSRNLLPLERPPRHRMHRRRRLARLEFIARIYGIPRDFPFLSQPLQAWLKGLFEQGNGDEEFNECFLEDKPAWWAPAVNLVARLHAVDSGLGGDGPEFVVGG